MFHKLFTINLITKTQFFKFSYLCLQKQKCLKLLPKKQLLHLEVFTMS
jgi:hypothetical protein